MATLKTSYKDYVADGDKKYHVTANADGTSGIADATTYSQTGDTVGASDLNATNTQVNTNTGDIATLNQNLALKTGFYYSTTAKSGASIHYQAVSLTFAASEKTTHITFEAPFAAICAGVFTQIEKGYTTTNPHIAVTNKTATGCDLVYSANTAFTVVVDFIAIGY